MGCDVKGVPSQGGPQALVRRGSAGEGFTHLFHTLPEGVKFQGLPDGSQIYIAIHFSESKKPPAIPVKLVALDPNAVSHIR